MDFQKRKMEILPVDTSHPCKHRCGHHTYLKVLALLTVTAATRLLTKTMIGRMRKNKRAARVARTFERFRVVFFTGSNVNSSHLRFWQ